MEEDYSREEIICGNTVSTFFWHNESHFHNFWNILKNSGHSARHLDLNVQISILRDDVASKGSAQWWTNTILKLHLHTELALFKSYFEHNLSQINIVSFRTKNCALQCWI